MIGLISRPDKGSSFQRRQKNRTFRPTQREVDPMNNKNLSTTTRLFDCGELTRFLVNKKGA